MKNPTPLIPKSHQDLVSPCKKKKFGRRWAGIGDLGVLRELSWQLMMSGPYTCQKYLPWSLSNISPRGKKGWRISGRFQLWRAEMINHYKNQAIVCYLFPSLLYLPKSKEIFSLGLWRVCVLTMKDMCICCIRRPCNHGESLLPSDLAWMVRKFIVTATDRKCITVCVCVCVCVCVSEL